MSCSITPSVINNKTGRIVNSVLFMDSIYLTNNNRDLSRVTWSLAHNDEFRDDFKHKLTIDDNNEPTLNSMMSIKEVRDLYLDKSTDVSNLNRQLGFYKKGTNEVIHYPADRGTFDMLVNRAIEFNDNDKFNQYFVAKVVRNYDEDGNEYLTISADHKTTENAAIAENMRYNRDLNKKLETMLNSWGVGIGALTETEERLFLKGVSDFSLAKEASNGLINIIRISKGLNANNVIPEEFSHFCIRALKNNPLIRRLTEFIVNNNLNRVILSDKYNHYDNLFSGNQYMMAEESTAKLLADYFLHKNIIDSHLPYKSLLSRAINATKDFFKNKDINEINRIVREVDANIGEIANGIMEDKFGIDKRNIDFSESSIFHDVDSISQKEADILKKIIDIEKQRYNILAKAIKNGSPSQYRMDYLAKLELDLDNKQYMKGIVDFIKSGNYEMSKLYKNMASIVNESDSNVFKELIKVDTILKSYRKLAPEIQSAINGKSDVLISEFDNFGSMKSDVSSVQTVFNKFLGSISKVQQKYDDLAVPSFLKMVKEFTGNTIMVAYGARKGTYNLNDIILHGAADISVMDRWVNSMGESGDLGLRALDSIVKRKHEESRFNHLTMKKKLLAAGRKAEKSGIRNFEWMFEKDSDGNKTGNYIAKINDDYFNLEMAKEKIYLDNKYGEFPDGVEKENKEKEFKQWTQSNDPNTNSKYWTDSFKEISRNSDKLEFYNTIIDCKKELAEILPPYAGNYLAAPKIRKDMLERVKRSKGVLSGAKEIWEALRDDYVVRSDDQDFTTISSLKDFDNKEVQSVPIYYTKMKNGESLNDISTDVISTMIAFSAMAYDYDAIEDVIDGLTVGKDIMGRIRTVTKTIRKGRNKNSNEIDESDITEELQGNMTNQYQKILDFYLSQLYKKYTNSSKTESEANIKKSIGMLQFFTAISDLGLNVPAAINNLLNNTYQIFVSSTGGQFFNMKDILTAQAKYMKYLPGMLSNTGSRIKTDFLSLFAERYEINQEYEKRIYDIKFRRKTWLGKLMSWSNLFFLSNMGDHFSNTIVALAMAHKYKLYYREGGTIKSTNLLDALKIENIDSNDKSLGANLNLDKTKYYTDSECKNHFSDNDEITFSKKMHKVSNKLFGIYNKQDQTAFQRTIVGKLVSMFRTWIVTSFNNRYAKSNYDFDLETTTEGFHNTMYRFLRQTIKEMRHGQFQIAKDWKNLDKWERRNVMQSITELATLTCLFFAIQALAGSKKGLRKRTWLTKASEYQTRRLFTEVASIAPTFAMPYEAVKILNSPAAAINTFQNTLDLLELPIQTVTSFDYMYNEKIKSGRFKGRTRAHKVLMNFPGARITGSIYKTFHPEVMLPYLRNSRF